MGAFVDTAVIAFVDAAVVVAIVVTRADVAVMDPAVGAFVDTAVSTFVDAAVVMAAAETGVVFAVVDAPVIIFVDSTVVAVVGLARVVTVIELASMGIDTFPLSTASCRVVATSVLFGTFPELLKTSSTSVTMDPGLNRITISLRKNKKILL